MSLGLIATASIVVMGVSMFPYLMSNNSDSSKVSPPPEWLKKLKGKQGILFTSKLSTVGDSTRPAICEQISDIFGKKENGRTYPSELKNSFHDWICDKEESQDDDQDSDDEQTEVEKGDIANSERYYGIFFEGDDTLNNCESLKNSEELIIYVDLTDKEKYKEFKDWTSISSDNKCNLNENSSDNKSLLSGKLKDLVDTELMDPHKINVLNFLKN